MANDILITRKVEVKNDNDPVNRYLLDNDLAVEGEYVDRLLLENGDLERVMDIERIKQHIISGLHIVKTDWILDPSEGIAYFSGMRAYPEILSAQIKHAIATVEGVDTVLKYSFDIDRDNIFHVSATVLVGNSEIPINEAIDFNTGVTA